MTYFSGDPALVATATSDGNLHASSNGGDSWSTIAANLPSIRSVSCEHYSD